MSAYSKKLQIIALFLLLAIVSGCSRFGPRSLPPNREGFNTALQNSDKAQILLNIVRLRYNDTPYFLGVDSIASTLSLRKGVEGTASFTNQTGDTPGNISFLSVTPSVTTEERPTISYVPLQGPKFTEQLLWPVSLEDLYLLGQSGWSLARLLRVTVQSVGEVPNAPTAARPDTTHVPEFRQFVSMAHLMGELHRETLINLQGTKAGNDMDLRLEVQRSGHDDPRINRLFSLLRVQGSPQSIKLTQSSKRSPEDLQVVTRSFIAMLYYLSKGVEVSPEEIASGVVVQPRLPNGQFFDWNEVTEGMIKVHMAKQKPLCAYLAVYYRCRWYYIADNDSNSKSTIAMIQQIFELLASEITSHGPVLTLPV